MLIYSDSIVLDREWLPSIDFGDAIEISHDIDKFEQSPAAKKIAFTAHRLHVDHDTDLDFEIKVRRLSQSASQVFCLESELHGFHWQIWRQCHRDNVYWLLPGMINDRADIQDHIIFWGDWFKTTANLYKKLPDKLDLLRPHDVKPRYFDALLGSPKPHRRFVADAIQTNNVQDKMILTYGGRWRKDDFYARDYFIWEPGCVPQQKIIGTADWVEYHGHQAHLSQIIPIDVYNQCAYSIVAETDHDNTLSFFSEKTAKAILARRLFVIFSGYKFLDNLKSLGFKTFDIVIDESYDTIRNDSERYHAAFKQVMKLCELDQQEILQCIRHVVDYNHELIMQRDWNKYALDRVKDKIRSLIAIDH